MRTIAGESVVVGEGMAQINFNKLISLNSSAALLWQSIEGKEFTVEDLCNTLLENYDVSEDVARKDSEAIANAWIAAGIVSECHYDDKGKHRGFVEGFCGIQGKDFPGVLLRPCGDAVVPWICLEHEESCGHSHGNR